MSDFEKALRASISTVDEGYQTALADLKREVTAASESVANVTQFEATLTLTKMGEHLHGTIYELGVKYHKYTHPIVAFGITPYGYPIKVGGISGLIQEGSYERLLDSNNDLKAYFLTLATQPDSSLLFRLAWVRRQMLKEGSQRNIESAGEHENPVLSKTDIESNPV